MKNWNNKRNRTGAQVLLVSAALLALLVPVTGLAQDECEMPLFVKQNLMGANVMILADNSGSMNAATYHAAYSPSVTYTGDFTSTSNYTTSRNDDYSPKDFNWNFADAPDAPLVVSDNGQRARYLGNYLNWVYYHATPEQRASIPQETRIQVLKAVLDRVIARSERLRFGLTIFNFNDGGRIIASLLTNTLNNLFRMFWIRINDALFARHEFDVIIINVQFMENSVDFCVCHFARFFTRFKLRFKLSHSFTRTPLNR